jgi:acyl-CoA dehydrogenase
LAYDAVDLPNANVFKTQIEALKALLVSAPPDDTQARSMDFLLTLGELFTLVAYGQLLIEKWTMDRLDPALLDQIFDFMIRDFSRFALALYSHPGSSPAQMERSLQMIRKPADNPAQFDDIWQRHVILRAGSYTMND